MSKHEIIYVVIGAVFVIGLQLFSDLSIFKHRGFVKKDNPDDNNAPLISGPADASAWKIIDESKKSSNHLDK